MGSFAIDQDQDGAWLDDIARTIGVEAPKVMGEGMDLIGGPFGEIGNQALGLAEDMDIAGWGEAAGDFWSDLAGTRGEASPGTTDAAYRSPESAAQTPGNQVRGLVGDTPASLISAGVGAMSGGLAGAGLSLGGWGLLTGAAGAGMGGAAGGLLGGAGGGVLGGVGGAVGGGATGAMTGASLGAMLGPLGMLGGGLIGGLGGALGGGLTGGALGGAVGASGGATAGSLGGGVLGTMGLPVAGAIAGATPALMSLYGHYAE